MGRWMAQTPSNFIFWLWEDSEFINPYNVEEVSRCKYWCLLPLNAVSLSYGTQSIDCICSSAHFSLFIPAPIYYHFLHVHVYIYYYYYVLCSYNPLADRILSCPPQDWRTPHVIDMYNNITKRLCEKHNMQFLDTNDIMGIMWDRATDFCHFQDVSSFMESKYILSRIFA